jgi:hypothetical protein
MYVLILGTEFVANRALLIVGYYYIELNHKQQHGKYHKLAAKCECNAQIEVKCESPQYPLMATWYATSSAAPLKAPGILLQSNWHLTV